MPRWLSLNAEKKRAAAEVKARKSAVSPAPLQTLLSVSEWRHSMPPPPPWRTRCDSATSKPSRMPHATHVADRTTRQCQTQRRSNECATNHYSIAKRICNSATITIQQQQQYYFKQWSSLLLDKPHRHIRTEPITQLPIPPTTPRHQRASFVRSTRPVIMDGNVQLPYAMPLRCGQ